MPATAVQKKVSMIPAKPQYDRSIKLSEKKLRVAAYCRVSTELEEQESSYEAQVEYYTRKIQETENWKLAGIYADDGKSATNTKKRDDFKDMIKDAEGGKIDMILTKSVSRFARNTVDSLLTIRKLKEKNVAVVFEKEGVNTLDGTGEILITILSSLAQEESRNISENTRWGVVRKFEKGKVIVNHNKFMGYTKNENGDLVIVPKEAEIVRLVFRLYLEGYSAGKIAKYLEEQKIKTATGLERWHDTVVLKMLRNEKYMGDALLQKTYTVDFMTKKKVMNKGIVPQYYVEDDHEAIIPRALFLQVQEEIARRGSQVDCMGRRRGFSAKHCFTGLLYCAECGEQFRRIHWNNRGCKSVVWRCMTRLEKKGACHARTVYEESLKQAFVEALNQLTGGSETYLSILQENMAEVIEMEQSNLPEEIQRKLDVLQKKLIECAERHEDYEEIAQEIFRLREQKEQALRENVSQQEQKDRMRELQEFLVAQPHHITEFDETLVRHLLAKVTVSSDRLNFTFQSGVAVSIEK